MAKSWIRNPIKIGTVTPKNEASLPLKIEVGHGGTISQLFFRCRVGGSASTIAQMTAAIKALSLKCTHITEGGITLLNQVTPKFLIFRESYYYESLMMAAGAGIMTYDPAAGVGKSEDLRNQLTLGTNDLKDMSLEFDFSADASGVDLIEVYADIDYNLVQPLGSHVRIGKTSGTVLAQGGEVDIVTLPTMDSRYAFNAIHIEERIEGVDDQLTVDAFTVMIDGVEYPLQDIPVDVINKLLEYGYRKPQDGFATLDFNKEDLPLYGLPAGMTDLKVSPNFEAVGNPVGGTVTCWYELVRKGV